jgi:Ca-activated chloride channel homolog
MVFLNIWVLFALVPLFFLYKKQIQQNNTRQIKLLYLSLVFMFFTAARPALEKSFTDEMFNSQDYIIAIDASFSMQADDLKPTRYELAKQAIQKLLLLHPKDRFTLFAFTSKALLISPPTTDTTISMQALNALNPNYILTKSTSLQTLFQTVAKLSLKDKKLIVFSDGGDEKDINKLLTILKQNNIVLYIVATASTNGSALKKEGKYLKDSKNSLVISKRNPILESLADASSGNYYELSSLSVVDQLSEELSKNNSSELSKLKVQSYKELFYIPLLIAFILYFISVTKLHQLIIFLPLIFLPYKVSAGIFDFYHLDQAQLNYINQEYKKSAQEFAALKPSVKSYYNSAGAYYKAKQYKTALQYYYQIKTPNKVLKANIYYNMGNCAVQLKQYDQAQRYYTYAIALNKDQDALHNLNLIRSLHLKTQAAPAKPSNSSKEEKKAKMSHSQNKKQQESQNSSASNRNADQSVNGAGGNKKKKKESSSGVKTTQKKDNYILGYKAYEIINKGYADEKEPW